MRVVVIMSTYNGSRFVSEQIDSILAQLPGDGLLLVRDDGSSDGTVDRVNSLNDGRIRIVRGANLGFGRSFLTLLASVPTDAQMVMFSDQDDVWLPGKIVTAWRHLAPLTVGAALYCSAQILVDENLIPLQVTPPWPRGASFESALAENIVTGCTAALNRAAIDLVCRAGVPQGVLFHDWWLYLTVSAMGTVIVDDQPTLLYRQHGSNVIGRGSGWLGRHWQMVPFLIKHDWVGILLGQVLALHQHYGAQLTPWQRGLLQRYFSIRDRQAVPRWRLVFSLRRWRQSYLQEVMFRALLAFHRLRLWPLPGRRL